MDPFREPPGASRGLFCVFRTFGVGYRVLCAPPAASRRPAHTDPASCQRLTAMSKLKKQRVGTIFLRTRSGLTRILVIAVRGAARLAGPLETGFPMDRCSCLRRPDDPHYG